MFKFFKPSPKLVTLFLAGTENRKLLERNAWKEQGGWEKKAAHNGLVKEDAKGHLGGGIMKIHQWPEIPENQQEKSKGSQIAAEGQALSVPDTNSIGSPEYHISSKAYFWREMKFTTHLEFIFILFSFARKCSAFHLIICKWKEKVGCV